MHNEESSHQHGLRTCGMCDLFKPIISTFVKMSSHQHGLTTCGMCDSFKPIRSAFVKKHFARGDTSRFLNTLLWRHLRVSSIKVVAHLQEGWFKVEKTLTYYGY